jgi:hypothetical protein
MSSATALTGRFGKFRVGSTNVARVSEWEVSPSLAHKAEWGDSDSAGFTNRMGGRKDCKFSAQGKHDTAAPQYSLFAPGDIVAANLFMDIQSNLGWTFPRALCEDFKLVLNMDTEDVVGWTSAWGADGEYLPPGSTSGWNGV